MITTSVKGAGSQIMNLGMQGMAKVQQNNGTDVFQDILNRQTGSDQGKMDRAARNDGVRPGRDAANRHRDAVDRQDQKEDLDEKARKTAEAAADAVMQMMQMLSEVTGLSAEELDGLMDQMGIQGVDLLKNDVPGSLMMEALNVEGSFDLVTNAELYEKYSDLMETQKALRDALSKVSGMEPEEALQTVEEGFQEPAISVEMQGDALKERMDTAEENGENGDFSMAQMQEDNAEVQASQQSGQKETDSGRQDSSSHDRGHGKMENVPGAGNLVLQQMIMDGTEQVNAQQEAAVSGSADTDTQMIMRQIMDYMKVQIRPDVSSLEMQLHPASLGTIQVQLTGRGGAVTAQFIAQNETVKEALETQMIQLKESFEAQGIRVEAIEVSVQTGGFEQNLMEKGREQENQQAASSGRRRNGRIQLDSQLTPEQLESLTGEEKLAAEMMTANGGTVDYMA